MKCKKCNSSDLRSIAGKPGVFLIVCQNCSHSWKYRVYGNVERGSRIYRAVVITLALVLVASVALAQYPFDVPHPMYCSTVVIRPGFTAGQVVTFCGDPAGRFVLAPGYEIWTYPNDLSEWDFYLTFYNGRLEAIERD